MYQEVIEISEKLSDLGMEKDALLQQEAIFRKFQYHDRSKQCRRRIKEIDEAIEQREELENEVS